MFNYKVLKTSAQPLTACSHKPLKHLLLPYLPNCQVACNCAIHMRLLRTLNKSLVKKWSEENGLIEMFATLSMMPCTKDTIFNKCHTVLTPTVQD